MSGERTRLATSLKPGDVADIFQMTLQGQGVQFHPIEEDPFASVREQRPILQVVASHDKNIGSWAVQLYLFDEGDRRILVLVALHDRLIRRAQLGTRYTISKWASTKKVGLIVAALRKADPSLMISQEE